MGRIRRSASAALALLVLLAATVDSGSGVVQDSMHACPGGKRGLGRMGLCMVHPAARDPVGGNTGFSRRGLCMAAPPPVQDWNLWDSSWGPSKEGLFSAQNFPNVEENDPEEVLSSIPKPQT